ncbi:hypothetical protein C4D60_Mb10t02430 [Musa balbisiana]|uniref:CBS domain-containing protein n=1 Tax=Musa balbisiana TaxID=52838 RepID=A0A4S8IU42_MUSBA|nr:hypothetical protein C4D60_Mb10t02430 [Musa balbisiana]
MDGQVGGGSLRRSRSGGSVSERKNALENGSAESGRWTSTPRPSTMSGDRTVKRLRLSKALTIPENATVREACRRMAARRTDAVLLTDSNALLCGILTDKDITTRVIAQELKLEETPVSKVMTRDPIFVLSDTLAVEALQKMVQGKFRHLPIVENGEVIALLDIAKCLHDAITRMERAAEKGKAMVAAVEAMEKHWGTTISGPNTFIETLRVQMLRPSLSTIIEENSKFVTVSPTDSVLTATKKMLELKISSAIVTIENKPQGILTSRDILMRVVTKNLSPESTPMEKVMTPNPECGTVDTPILDALHTMHDRKFLHLPVVDRDGFIVSVVDVIRVAHAAIATRVGDDIDKSHLPQILYEDEDHDKVILASDGDLVAAVDHARQAGLKSLRLHLDHSGLGRRKKGRESGSLEYAHKDAWAAAYSTVAAGAAFVAGIGVMAYLKRSAA